MNHINYLTAKIVCPLFLMGMLVSCEDKALVQENEALLEQIAESEAMVEVLEIKVGENPSDQSVKLEQNRKLLIEAAAQLEELHTAKIKVVLEHESMKKEFQQYRTTYQIK